MAKKKKSQWRLRCDDVEIDGIVDGILRVDRRGKWTAGLEVEIKEIDFGLNRTFYHLSFRWNGNDGWCGEMFAVKVRREEIPANLVRGEWANNGQAKSMLRRLLPMASKGVKEQYNRIVKKNPWAAV